ncbi:CGNR zinc finger domain-containing protein [Bosea sp. (in: a-proteobacteria)]|jgi:predicted RNA-binding Zn ribbon-like protein|uniref:CGNR zinc finger domain-containing protein n=1 Tax=Bosea sp. (in: a-proteobacteria) TaxID=1871050 RepID=UPI002DDD4F28|nr:CGNR zinc finger domain-containing protein [Bosea sp. (in: a-proteobacteria)]HEV2508044.1 CGNR zinc finger domain-containing protein [Bosea sp. (in: a-proteobacteria)]
MAPATEASSEFRDGFPFVGGAIWLDLLNTTPAGETGPQELIDGPERALAWLKAAGLGEETGDANEAMGDLRALRAELRPVFEGLAAGQPLPDTVLASVNRRLAGLSGHHVLKRGEDGLTLGLAFDPARPAALIALDLARFVCEAEPDRLKRCAADDCTLVFYDRGRNNTRRWCTMSLCGNRDKVARFRARRTAR